ncbi:helix-turn-helix domain-containing protein [Micromonospora sp. NPDC003197]
MSVAMEYILEELRHARASRGLSQEEFGKLIRFSASHVSSVETGQRSPTVSYMEAVDAGLQTGGLFLRMLKKLGALEATPIWLREWIIFERQATTLRWFEPLVIPGLFQTEAYARATLAGGRFTAEEAEQQLAARLERQAILDRDNPPHFIAVIDEAILRRPVPDHPGLMAEQLERLVTDAERENVQLHVVPAEGIYLGFAGQFIIAELPDGGRVAYADNQLRAQIMDDSMDIARLTKTWEAIRSIALPRRQSIDLIKDVAKTWT